MTPDTTIYMIFGLSSIVVGVIGYAISLVIRQHSIQRKIEKEKKED